MIKKILAAAAFSVAVIAPMAPAHADDSSTTTTTTTTVTTSAPTHVTSFARARSIDWE